MKVTKIHYNQWKLTPKKQAWDFQEQIRFLGAKYNSALKCWYTDSEDEGKYICQWVKEHLKRYGK